jgi:hypothetical protein
MVPRWQAALKKVWYRLVFLWHDEAAACYWLCVSGGWSRYADLEPLASARFRWFVASWQKVDFSPNPISENDIWIGEFYIRMLSKPKISSEKSCYLLGTEVVSLSHDIADLGQFEIFFQIEPIK